MASFSADKVSITLNRVQTYFPDQELCSIITDGVSRKSANEVINPGDVRGGLREANWSRYLLRYITTEVKDESQRLRILTAFLSGIHNLTQKPREFFTYACDFGDSCSSISIRLLAHVVKEANGEFSDRLSVDAKRQIDEVYALYKSAVDKRNTEQEERTTNFNILFPSDKPEYELLRTTLLTVDNEISPKKLDKQLIEVCKTSVSTSVQLLEQYFNVLNGNRQNPLAKALIKKFQGNFKHYDHTYKGNLDPAIQLVCEKWNTILSQAV